MDRQEAIALIAIGVITALIAFVSLIIMVG